MTRFAPLSAAAALLLATPLMADTGTETEQAQGTPAKLKSFDGGKKFLKTSRQLRVWRESVGYTLTVDATGKATDCKIQQKFDRTVVNMRLCEVLVDHHEFEPARDANDMAVEGTYSARLVYADLRGE